MTADHRLFDKQAQYFERRYNVIVWDAPAHGSSWPFRFDFDLFDKAKWLNDILSREGITKPVIIGQSMGGYVDNVCERSACAASGGGEKIVAKTACDGITVAVYKIKRNEE